MAKKKSPTDPKKIPTDPKKTINFYSFWRWEYQRRNEEYNKDFQSLMDSVKKGSKNTKKSGMETLIESSNKFMGKYGTELLKKMDSYFKNYSENRTFFVDPDIEPAMKEFDKKVREQLANFYDKHKIYPRDPNKGFPSEHIIDNILNKINFIPEVEASSYDDFHFQLIENLSVVPQSSPLMTNIINVDIDLTAPVELVVKEITYQYEIQKNVMNEILRSHSTDTDAILNLNTEPITKAFADLSKYLIDMRGFKTFKVDNSPRAVGIYLWDYCKTNNCSDIKAAKDFDKRYSFGIGDEEEGKHPKEHLGFSASPELNVFTRILRNTRKCINDIKLYRLS